MGERPHVWRVYIGRSLSIRPSHEDIDGHSLVIRLVVGDLCRHQPPNRTGQCLLLIAIDGCHVSVSVGPIVVRRLSGKRFTFDYLDSLAVPRISE